MTKPALNRHQRRRQRTQTQLEQATSDLLIENGFEALTIHDIAEQADLGRGTFYLHFQDKEQAVWSLTERVLREGDSLSALANANLSSPVNLITGIANFFQHTEQHRELFMALLGSQASPAVANQLHAWLSERLQPITTALADHRRHPATPIAVTTQLFTGAFVRMLYWWLSQPNPPFSAEKTAEMILEPFFSMDAKK
jgi:AcrR family transcriptional regulator